MNNSHFQRMIRWVALQPCDCLRADWLIGSKYAAHQKQKVTRLMRAAIRALCSLLLSSLELSDAQVEEPCIRALLGTASHFCEGVALKSRTVPNCSAPDACVARRMRFGGSTSASRSRGRRSQTVGADCLSVYHPRDLPEACSTGQG